MTGRNGNPDATSAVRDHPLVVIEPGDSFDHALRRFTKLYERAGVKTELRRRTFAMSAGTRRRMKARLARARARRQAQRAATREPRDD